MDRFSIDDPVFIIDLNELEDGDRLPVSVDFTLMTHITRSSQAKSHMPAVGDRVRVHSDDDNTLYYAKVLEILSERDFIAQIQWDSCTESMTEDWSARTESFVRSTAGIATVNLGG